MSQSVIGRSVGAGSTWHRYYAAFRKKDPYGTTSISRTCSTRINTLSNNIRIGATKMDGIQSIVSSMYQIKLKTKTFEDRVKVKEESVLIARENQVNENFDFWETRKEKLPMRKCVCVEVMVWPMSVCHNTIFPMN